MQQAFDITINHEIDARLDAAMVRALEEMEQASPRLTAMGKYHLGWLDRSLRPVAATNAGKGKRIRPKVALLCCQAVSGDIEPALQVAAAIELLHNFTLIHDDIQDASSLRRHRETIWSIWGVGQAINLGDALFAASHRLLLASVRAGISAETVVRLASEFDRMTIDIVGGQVRDLEFEVSAPATVDDYLGMIERKTAAIVEYAAWAGAIAGGGDEAQALAFGQFGLALGLGFQLQDDVLGTWGKSSQTGKAEADDIRRKKQSLPVVLLRESASAAELCELDACFSRRSLSEEDISAVLDILSRHRVREKAARLVADYHDRAEVALDRAAAGSSSDAIASLRALVSMLSTREH